MQQNQEQQILGKYQTKNSGFCFFRIVVKYMQQRIQFFGKTLIARQY